MYIAATIIVVFIVVAFVLVVVVKGKTNDSPAKKQVAGKSSDTDYSQRLSYLLKIVMEHSSKDQVKSSTREVIRIGEEVHQAGGFRLMLKIHEAVTQQTSPKYGHRLSKLWKGIGEWRGK